MKLKFIILLLVSFLLACNSDDNNPQATNNNVLMLKVDYTTNNFEGGTEFNFSQSSPDFTIVNEYEEPEDFGSVKLIYEEINQTLFYGTIHWMGLGEMEFPENLIPANQFIVVDTADFILPLNGFENVFDPNNLEDSENYDYQEVWSSVQNLVKVREYMGENPDQTVKMFLYTPSVGLGDPIDWDWIIYMKK